MDLKREPTLIKKLKTEMHELSKRINKEKNSTKKAKMVKAFHRMSKALS
ncbi:MAG: hypothetical protein JSV12_06590 [Candidatus Bathyarchaeota archaeon]|nr:MAG: hypothetical protein JSV12_06590 [Candidatus Bathyarchaeota archaeon]